MIGMEAELNFQEVEQIRRRVTNMKRVIDEFSKELNLLLAIIKLDNNPNYLLENNELLVDIDWKEFIYLAKHHRIYPTIYENVINKDINNIPESVINTLHHLCSKNTVNMLSLTAEMGTVCQILENNNIESLVLKGPVLADYLYGDISKRTSKDLDILVPINKIEKVEELLYSLGYQLESYHPRILKDWKRTLQHLSFVHPIKHIQVEVHIYLNIDMGLKPTFNSLWERRNESYIAGKPVYSLGTEDLFLYLVSHGAKHAWFRLRWLVDIDRMITKEFNYKSLFELLKKYQANISFGQALTLCLSLFDTKIKKEFKEFNRENKHQIKLLKKTIYFINQGLIPHSQENSKKFRKHYKKYLNSIRTKRQNLLIFKNRLYPNCHDASVLPLPKPLHFLYFPLRPFTWSFRKIKRMRSVA
ncbi:nucleotidyltransferase domain-containing protein [Gracilibacillus massiliensis]|uniref:nucleotidyltransferase domain-containing protein n=1 Tax=Gracilibacillus massiliensis TaxID=1564956 RepID=UPI00071E4EFB|nr:nucleotidyltransferase family protein [Gracilibacillus massiliensis]